MRQQNYLQQENAPICPIILHIDKVNTELKTIIVIFIVV